MSRCDSRVLVQLLDNRLRLNARLKILDHLDGCETCRVAIYHLSRDRDKKLFIYKPHKQKKATLA